MTETCLLEVLVPTYGRPEAAIRAIKSVLSINDTRVRVRCNSNGPEPALNKFCADHPDVCYGQFETNMGPAVNAFKLISDAQSKFVMLLSDEDQLESALGARFLDFLEALDSRTNVVSCSVHEAATDTPYYNLGNPLHGRYVNLAGFTILSSSTYMSGYVWKLEALRNLGELRNLLGANETGADGSSYNAYGHVDVSQQLLTAGICAFFMDKLVMKGATIESGGHAYSHVTEENSTAYQQNLNLNPAVYGPYARVRQFFYRELLLTKLRDNFPALAFFVAEAQLYTFFFERLCYSPKVVLIPSTSSLESEAIKAIADAIEARHFSESPLSNLFRDSILRTSEEADVAYEKMKALKSGPPAELIVHQLLIP